MSGRWFLLDISARSWKFVQFRRNSTYTCFHYDEAQWLGMAGESGVHQPIHQRTMGCRYEYALQKTESLQIHEEGTQASGSLQVLPAMLCEPVDGSSSWSVELRYIVAWLIQFCTDALQLAYTRFVNKTFQKNTIIPWFPRLAAREKAQRRSPHGYRRRKMESKCLHIPILIF